MEKFQLLCAICRANSLPSLFRDADVSRNRSLSRLKSFTVVDKSSALDVRFIRSALSNTSSNTF